jgi:nitrous oxidase accessory protein NosD
MKSTRIVSSALGAALGGLLLGAGPVLAQEVELVSSSGGTLHITRPGSYRLRHNVTLRSAGTAVVISSGGVSLDLGGHALIGPGGKQGIGVLVEGGHDVSVRNGTIQGFGFGVQVMNAFNVKIQGLQINGEDGGGPAPGEVGTMVVNSRGVEAFRNTISRVFLGIFVRGGGTGGNRIAENTLAAGANGQLGVCYNPDGLGTPAGPSGDLVYNNLVSGFNIGIQTSAQSAGNIFRENDIAFVQQAVQELSPPGANVFAENTEIGLN